MKEQILNLRNDPEGLERLFRESPDAFRSHFPSAFALEPESLLFRAWNARFQGASPADPMNITGWMVLLALVFMAGTAMRIPMFWHDAPHSLVTASMIALGPFAALLGMQLHRLGWPRRKSMVGLAGLALTAVYMALIPESWDDTRRLAWLHLPILMWGLYTYVRMGRDWNTPQGRIQFIRFFGELLIMAGLLLLGGVIILLITAGLFDLLDIRSYLVWEYVGIYGQAGIGPVALWATDTHSAARRIVPLMARIFAPLLISLTVAYMAAMAFNASNLFLERDSLISYNCLLLGIFVTAVFILTGRREHGESPFVVRFMFVMLTATVLLDALGLSIVLQRTFEMGMTANRLAVIGFNVAIIGALGRLALDFFRHAMKKADLDRAEAHLASYLNIFLLWGGFMVLIAPWIFGY